MWYYFDSSKRASNSSIISIGKEREVMTKKESRLFLQRNSEKNNLKDLKKLAKSLYLYNHDFL